MAHPSASRSALNQLARRYGIEPEYTDGSGVRRTVGDETKLRLLEAMGLVLKQAADAKALLAGGPFSARSVFESPVLVVPDGPCKPTIFLTVPKEHLDARFEWKLIQEQGQRNGDVFVPSRCIGNAKIDKKYDERSVSCVIEIPFVVPLGYHRLEVREPNQGGKPADLLQTAQVIMTPCVSYIPQGLMDDSRVWGPTLRLPAVRSVRNWGMGDFTDLATAIQYCAEAGAGILGLSPLHCLSMTHPVQTDTYRPSSRSFFDPRYLDVEAIEDFAECEDARANVHSAAFQAGLAALRESDGVNESEVWAIKAPLLEKLYRHFRQRHLATDSDRARAFRNFQASRNKALWGLGVFEALQEHFQRKAPRLGHWRTWPADYHDPASRTVIDFASTHKDRVEFFQYLQWQCDQAMAALGSQAMGKGLKVGLCGSVVMDVAPHGFETWYHRDVFAHGVTAQWAPDESAAKDETPSGPPMIPAALMETEYGPFVSLLRANMRHTGAICIEDISRLFRSFWIPEGLPSSQGAYVRYPLEDLLGILALEAQRNLCLLIWKSRTTLPAQVRSALTKTRIWGHRNFYLEKEPDGAFVAPARYPADASVCLGDSKLPTLKAFWHSLDLKRKLEQRLFSSKKAQEMQIIARSTDRMRILLALRQKGLFPEGPEEMDPEGLFPPKLSFDLIIAIHQFMSQSPAKIFFFQPEDALDFPDPPPIWPDERDDTGRRRRLPVRLEDFFEEPRLQRLADCLRRERGVGIVPAKRRRQGKSDRGPAGIPLATYRIQLNKGFGFLSAAQWVAYLKRLGVTHLYASPFLKARPESLHGYDIVDHQALNPELGTTADFERFMEVLHREGMGLILDIVPNHMAAGSDNPWWVDVLENGQASTYASYFDIAWKPLKKELHGKVLLPILEDHYGIVLENGLLQLTFDVDKGNLSVGYYQHRFPLDPATYPFVLGHDLERLESRIKEKESRFFEFQSLLDAFNNLPRHWESDDERAKIRNRDKEVQKRQLRRQCMEVEEIREFIDENVIRFNGRKGHPASYDLLHDLLQHQPYRLAYWRVASDDINYRRFFDINDLAGLRMENTTVFEDTHTRVFDLIDQGVLQGLRIDHIDGLYDPVQYCTRLLEKVAYLEGWDTKQEKKPGEATASVPEDFYLVAEKILAEHEEIPHNWPVHGTTGYDFSSRVCGLFVDGNHEQALNRIYRRFIGSEIDFDELLYASKKLIINTAMAGELTVLANELNAIAESQRHTRDFTVNSLRDALREVVACFPVYRTYVHGNTITEQDRQYIDRAISCAKKRSPAADTTVYDFIHNVLALIAPEEGNPKRRNALVDFAMKLQQYTGPVMAKGMEDTAFYNYNRLVCLNEVGGDPRRFGVSLSAFHYTNKQRAEHRLHTMLNTSTHDSKRSEDVRARISCLSEIPDEWDSAVRRWSRLNRSKKQDVEQTKAPGKNDEYLFYQTLVGAWPIAGLDNEESSERFTQRIEAYMIKAVREAKVHSSWINQNTAYEKAVRTFVRAVLDRTKTNPFLKSFISFQKIISQLGMYNSLSQVLLKLTAPGVPDIFQGNEIWNFALVDPDNRRPIDYSKRYDMLRDLESFFLVAPEQLPARAEALMRHKEDGRIKIYITSKCLALRSSRRSLFQEGDYLPMAVQGEMAEHLCAFARKQGESSILVAAPRLYGKLCGPKATACPVGPAVWSDTRIEVPFCCPGTRFSNVFTGESSTVETTEGTRSLIASGLFSYFPVALLESVP